ncbi:MAG: TonB-dependent receptor, partial [Deltaproteobacteria bacterium]|nr:TonB-dependent receptor [Deltaproteobacteria bacterium]
MVLSLCLLVDSIAAAQTDSTASDAVDPWTDVETMLVVGDPGFMTSIEASTSIVAFDTEYLTAAGIQDIGDLAEFTPNLQISSAFAASSPELFIRGVGLRDSNSNAASAVAVISDGVYLNSTVGQLAQLFDVRAVNVLRGPQGTLYGRNASAGVIEIESQPPTGEVGAGLIATYGRFNQTEFEGFLETPIISDLLSVRLSGQYSRRDGLGENRCGGGPPFPPSSGVNAGLREGFDVACWQLLSRSSSPNPNFPVHKDTNDVDNWAARGLLLYTPRSDLEILVNFHGGQNLGYSPSFQNAGVRRPSPFSNLWNDRGNYFDFDRCLEVNAQGACTLNDPNPEAGDAFDGDYSFVGDERLDLFGTNVRVKWELGDWVLKSVTAYDQNKRAVAIDFDASPRSSAHRFLEDKAWQVSEDLRLLWDPGGRFDALLGIYALHEKIEALNIFPSAGGISQDFEQYTDYVGVFGFFSFELSETLTLELGARMNWEKKQFEITTTPLRLSRRLVDATTQATDIVPTADVILRYEPIENVGLYAKFVRGYKGRHFNAGGLEISTVIEPADPEFVNAFEMGFNTSWLDGLITWNAATFLYNYEGQQVFQLKDTENSAPIDQLINAE